MGAPTVRMESAMLLSEFIAGPHEAATARSYAQEAISSPRGCAVRWSRPPGTSHGNCEAMRV